MGSQESTDLENFQKSVEGNSITEISNSSFEQNIYVCGNYDIDFFENKLTEHLVNPRKNVSNYIMMAKHKDINEWHFLFSQKLKDFKIIEKNISSFIKLHNNDDDNEDEDDNDYENEFKEKNKSRIGKIVILYFNDNNKENIIDYFLNKHNIYKIPFVIFVGKKEENAELKKKIDKIIKDLKHDIDSNIFKFANFNDNMENNIIELTINLIECAAFYNELGDEFKFPKKLMNDKIMEKDLKEILNNFSTFNILLCGRPGVGKSTFINGLLKTMICKSGRGPECSKK